MALHHVLAVQLSLNVCVTIQQKAGQKDQRIVNMFSGKLYMTITVEYLSPSVEKVDMHLLFT